MATTGGVRNWKLSQLVLCRIMEMLVSQASAINGNRC